MEFSALHRRLSAVAGQAERVLGKLETLAARAAQVEQQVALAKARLGLDTKVTSVLEHLNERAHARAVGSFEKLLSAIVRDVFPEQQGVSLQLGAERGMPTLGISVRKGDFVHDVLDGAGGAVTNTVCAGLRFISLLRTAHRRLLVLDEPDAWISPDRVGRFFEVLVQVARNTHTQTVIITHHDSTLFGPDVAVVKLSRQDARVVAVPVRGSFDFANDKPGLRSIELVDFRSHEHTVIPLSAGVTAIVGDNDVGKSSALVGSLRAVAYGESDDDAIRDGRTRAVVRLRLEGATELLWTRQAKASPKVVYALFRDGQKVAEGRPEKRGQVPDWAREALGIGPVEGLDLHLGSQKSPVFLIDQPASQRARVLSVGRESARLSALMQAWADMKRMDRETVRQGEEELSALNDSLALRAQAERIHLELALHEAEAAHLQAELARESGLSEAIQGLLRRARRAAAGAGAAALVPMVPPALEDAEALARAIRRIESLTKKALAGRVGPAVRTADVVLTDTSDLARLVAWLEHLEHRAQHRLRAEPLLLPVDAVQDTKELASLVQRLGQMQQRAVAAHEYAQRADKDYRLLRQKLADLVQALGDSCPVCGAAIDEQGHAHAHAPVEH